MADEQFLNSDNIVESLSLVKKYMLTEIEYLVNKTKYNLVNFNYSTFSLPSEINELDKDTQYNLVSILHLCESVTIIDSKIGS